MFFRVAVFLHYQEVERKCMRNSQIVDLSRECSWIDPGLQAQ